MAVVLMSACSGGGDVSFGAPDPAFIQAVDEFEIEAAQVEARSGAPSWCDEFLHESVRKLATATMALGDPEFQDEVASTFEEASRSLESLGDDIPADVARDAERLARALESVSATDPTTDGTRRLQFALSAMGESVSLCGFE